MLGPLVETLVQGCIRDHDLQVHFYRDLEAPTDCRSRVHEVGSVAERIDGEVLPLEVKSRRRFDADDLAVLRHFRTRHPSQSAILGTRETSRWDAERRAQSIPLVPFLLAL